MVQAIDTEYNGRLYRSRLEARWAVFFEATWIRFDYEPEGYVLPSGPYLPDFFLRLAEPRHRGAGYWVEIKPSADLLTERAHRRMLELCVETGHNGYVVAGDPWPGEFETWKYSRIYPHRPDGGLIRHTPARATTRWPHVDSVWLLCTDVPWDDVDGAFGAARAARFEHTARGRHSFTRASSVVESLRQGRRIGGAIRRGDAQRDARPRPEGTESA